MSCHLLSLVTRCTRPRIIAMDKCDRGCEYQSLANENFVVTQPVFTGN